MQIARVSIMETYLELRRDSHMSQSTAVYNAVIQKPKHQAYSAFLGRREISLPPGRRKLSEEEAPEETTN